MAMQRHVPLAFAFAMVVVATPSTGGAQNGGLPGRGPGANTPHLLIATLHSADRALGVQMAQELRARIQDENSPRDYFVTR